MAASNSDHNYYTLEQRRQTSQSSPYHQSDLSDLNSHPAHRAATADTFSHLPTYNHRPPTHPSQRGPSATASFEQYVSDARLNGFTVDPPNLDNSPDPHDFYRQYRDPFRRESVEGYHQTDIVVARRDVEEGMTTSRSSPRSTLTTRANGTGPPLLASRVTNRSNQRNPSSTLAEKSPPSGAKSNPQLTNTVRNRQASLQDLVNKFNQTPDELPPLPAQPGSRSTSATRSPAVAHGPNHFRSRTPSDANQRGHKPTVRLPLAGKEESYSKTPISPQRKKHAQGDVNARLPRGNRRLSSLADNTQASQSMPDLNPRDSPSTRQPLFGEILAINTSNNPGYGIDARRRRGSEGSMHTPNPMFPNDHPSTGSKISPSSPTAWYLGVTPSLDGIDLEKPIPARPLGLHRRSRSDFPGSLFQQSMIHPPGKGIAVLPVQQESEPTSPLTNTIPPKRISQSRIPLSTRRMSITSDSGNSSPSTRANSAMDQQTSHRGQPSKTINHTAKSRIAAKISHVDPHATSNQSKKPPKRRNLSPLKQDPDSSPLLKAYISAPMPLNSPPLRSSRPRQPVSSATTSASRARAVERLAGNSGSSSSNTRENKSRNVPELGGIDFAARRQRIQQAFTKTIKEKEKQHQIEAERKRISLARTSQFLQDSTTHGNQGAPHRIDFPHDDCDADSDDHQDDERYATPAEEMPRESRELTIETANLPDKSMLDFDLEDSPTLGVADRFSSTNHQVQGSLTPPSDIEPTSAVTAETTDTFFDNEPQEDLESLHNDHRTLLSQIMSLREPSPATPPGGRLADPVIEAEGTPSDKDDRESIQIMLGATPITEQSTVMSKLLTRDEKNRSADVDNRSSGDSWSSSIRSNRHSSDREKDELTGMIDEHLPRKPDESAHMSYSTATSSYVPPWSPDSSLLSARTTMDSDSYSTINRVLESYHDHPSMMSPEVISDFQQHLIDQSPNLARAGGWDAKKVTQLYLQSRARSKHAQSNMAPEPLNLHRSVNGNTETPSHSQMVNVDGYSDALNTLSPDLVDGPEDQPEDQAIESRDKLTSQKLEVVDMLNQQRASLDQRSDWANISPSYLDWIRDHATETPAEEKPLSSFRDRNIIRTDSIDAHNKSTSRTSTDVQLKLPEIQQTEGGLGIDIHVESPTDSPTIPSHHDEPNDRYNQTRPPSTNAISPSPTTKPPSPPSSISDSKRGSPSGASLVNPLVDDTMRTNSEDSFQQIPAPAAPATRSVSTSRSQKPSGPDTQQTTADAPAKLALAQAEQKRVTRRRHIIQELVDTEKSFGQDMKVVDDIYKGTSDGLGLPEADIKVLFGNSDQIVQFSLDFLDALKLAVKSTYVLPNSKRFKSKRDSSATSKSGFTDDQSSINGVELGDDEKDRKTFVGSAFVENLTRMEKVYADYLKNHDAANQKLQILQKNETFQVWLNECRNYANDLTSAWDLDSLLVKPVQRILKYPLLLKELVEVTPENHPDFTALDIAARELVGVSKRINEMKKRADIVEQVAGGRQGRKDSDSRIGISKAFGRKTEKLKQHVGLSEVVQDREYNAVAEKFGIQFFQLQVVMNDFALYITEVEVFVGKFYNFIAAIESYIDVAQSSYPEVESKWRKFRMSMREIQSTALADHVTAIRKNVIDPMQALLKLFEGPQRFMHKRAKRVMDYVRYKALKDRGDKPDKKTSDYKDQFIALNDTLKEELPRLFSMAKRVVEASLHTFVQLQLQWQIVWRRKLSQAIDVPNVPDEVSKILASWFGDFSITEGQLFSLGVINKSLLTDISNIVTYHHLSPTTTLNGDVSSPRQSSTATNDSRSRSLSQGSEASPSLPQPDLGSRYSDNLGISHLGGNTQQSGSANQGPTGYRIRANSTASARSPVTPEMPGGWRTYSNSSTLVGQPGNRLSTSSVRGNETPSLPRLSVDTPGFNRLSGESQGMMRPPSSSTYYTASKDGQGRPSSPSHRYSNFFSSAMPMSDSPPADAPAEGSKKKDFNVLFIVASVYEFNIDRSRREAGYPYLTYIAGEIFDVIGEKGELWLAKNQDDQTNQVGWIWNKHFAKLAS